ncbi:MAG: MopE-related protein, partial [Polyangiales bacterium]
MRFSPWSLGPTFLTVLLVASGCGDDTECPDEDCVDACTGEMCADAGSPDSGTDSGTDAGPPNDGGPDGMLQDVMPDVVVIPTGPDDYVLCDSTLDCPAGRGRCLLNLPLHHPDSAGNALVAVSDVFAGVPDGRGVCAESCESSPGACGTSEFLTDAPNYTCQVVYAAPTPYALGGVDGEAMRAGDSFAALCRPSFSGAANRLPETCGVCASDSECGAGRCWDLAGGAPYESEEEDGGRCVENCAAELPCAQGFSCETTSAGDLCLPILATCESCVDADGDGFGLGFCEAETSSVTPVDCDDAEATTYYEADPICGAVDHNCNGFADDIDMVGTDLHGSLHCSACDDGCNDEALGDLAGSQWECGGDEGARTCEATCETGRFDCDMDGACEVDGTTVGYQWAPDADNDGAPCNPEPGSLTCLVVTACERPAGMVIAVPYSAAPFTCSDFLTCPDADDDNDRIAPGRAELCDILDNNQNGTIDETFAGAGARACLDGDTAEPCMTGSAVPLRGRCTTSCSGGSLLLGRWQCSESGVACVADSSGAEVACNGIDDNCNGRVDEPVGDACDSGGLDSPCRRGAALRCSGGLSCVPASASAYASVHDAPGDNYDADCDGVDGEADAIYVYSASVVPGEDGTAARPYRSLRAALDQADLPGGSDTIYVQSAPGVPVLLDDGPIDLRAGLRIYGGFTGALAWTYGASESNVCIPSDATPVTHTEPVLVPGRVIPPSTVVPPSWINLAMRAHIGLRCEGLTGAAAPAVVSQIALAVTGCGTGAAPAPSQVGSSVYGGIFIDCENVILRDLTVTNGAAGAGQAGTTPPQQTALGPWLGGLGGFGTGSTLLGFPGNGPNGGPRAASVGANGGWPSGGGSRGAPAVDPQPFPALPTAP